MVRTPAKQGVLPAGLCDELQHALVSLGNGRTGEVFQQLQAARCRRRWVDLYSIGSFRRRLYARRRLRHHRAILYEMRVRRLWLGLPAAGLPLGLPHQ